MCHELLEAGGMLLPVSPNAGVQPLKMKKLLLSLAWILYAPLNAAAEMKHNKRKGIKNKLS
jgi:hypothetical protein